MSGTYQSPDEVAKREGLKSTNELIGRFYSKNEIPACCNEECLVKPKDYCKHNQPSILIELNLA